MVQDFIKTNEYREHKGDYRWPSMYDFWLPLTVAPLFFWFEQRFTKIMYARYYPYCKEKKDLVVREIKTRKAVSNMYRFIYYVLSSTLGYLTLKDSYIFPPSLGGSGSIYNMFTDFPYITPPPLYRLYFTGSMGYHIGDLLHYAYSKKKPNDYLEMMLINLVTLYLYAFSYMTNTMIGAVIAFTHGLADICVSLTRAWAESEYSKVTFYSFLSTIIVWFYTRLIVLPYIIYVATIKLEVYALSPYVQPTFGFLLTCLLCMHIYWFYIFSKMFFNYIYYGSTEDLQNTTQKEEALLQKRLREEFKA